MTRTPAAKGLDAPSADCAAREHGAGKAQRLLGRASALLTRNPMGGGCWIADGPPLNVDQMRLGYMRALFPMDGGGKLRWRCPLPPRVDANPGEEARATGPPDCP
jgi:hypothetical protein